MVGNISEKKPVFLYFQLPTLRPVPEDDDDDDDFDTKFRFIERPPIIVRYPPINLVILKDILIYLLFVR